VFRQLLPGWSAWDIPVYSLVKVPLDYTRPDRQCIRKALNGAGNTRRHLHFQPFAESLFRSNYLFIISSIIFLIFLYQS
jgi:hypothetical protein